MPKFTQDLPDFDWNEPARPADPLAIALADAMIEVVAARAALDQGRKNVPKYTGDRSSEDYYAREQDEYNRAAERYADAVSAAVARAAE